jgi:hypothetical protein
VHLFGFHYKNKMHGPLSVKKEKSVRFPGHGNGSTSTNVASRKMGVLLHCIESISDCD